MTEDKPLRLEEYLARQIGSDASTSLPFREALALYRETRTRDAQQPYSGPDLELSPVQVRPASVGDGYEAELRADRLNSGDGGYWISVVGWGSTEAEARASLEVALGNLIRDAEDLIAREQG